MSHRLFDKRLDKYFRIENVVLERTDLDIYEKIGYIVLCRYANNHNGAFPSYQTLAKNGSMSKRKAIDVVQSLIGKNLIEKETRYKNGKKEHSSNVYYVLSAEVEQVPESSAHDSLPSAHDSLPSAHDSLPSAHGATPSDFLAPCNADATWLCDTPQNSYKDQSCKDPFRNINLERTNQSVSPGTLCQATDKPTEKKVSKIKSQEKTQSQLPVCEVTETDIKQQIGYSSLAPLGDKSLLDEVVLNMLDMYHSSGVKIKDEVKPQAIVHSVLNKVTYWHIVYLLERFKQVTTTIKNKKGYLQTMIYTSVLEQQAHYTNQVIVDQLAWAEEDGLSSQQSPQGTSQQTQSQHDTFEQWSELTDEELEKFYVDLN